VLRNRNFFRLWIGQIVASIGDRFYQFALLYVVLRLSPSEGMGVGRESARVLFSAMILPVLLAPWIGRILDRYGRRGLMVLSDAARALIALIMLGVWLVWGSPPALFVLIALGGLMTGIFIPARQAAVPALVNPAQLVPANALVTIIGVVASLAGAGAGLVVAVFGERSSFIITAVTFMFSAIMVAGITDPMHPSERPSDTQSPVDWPVWRDTIRASWRDRLVRGLITIGGIAQFIVGLFLVFVLEHTTRNLDLAPLLSGAQGFADMAVNLGFKRPVIEIRLIALVLMLVATGLGLVLGVSACGRIPRLSHLSALPRIMLMLLGIAFFGFAHIESYGAAWGAAVVIGLIGALLNVPLDARLQDRVSGEQHGRLFAFRGAVNNLCFLAALALNLDGRLIAWRGPEALIQDLGLACALFGGILVWRARRELTKPWVPADSQNFSAD
jgi:MFS family permease